MAENRLNKPEEVKKEKPSFFLLLDNALKLDKMFVEGIPVKHLPKIGFLFILCLFYIGYNHQSNKIIIRLNKAKVLLEDMRVDYTTQKAQYMYRSKQSVVADSIRKYGVMESEVPPSKVILVETKTED